MTPNNRGVKSIDWFTIILYVLLVGFGWLNIYAANTEPDTPFLLDLNKEFTKQLIWIGISIITIGVLLLADSKFFVEFAYIFYIFSVLLLIIVIFVGVEVNAARSWFQIGSMRFQPMELAKVSTALAIARTMSRFQFSFNNYANVFRLFLLWVTPMAIIVLQNDTGSALVFLAFLIMFFREGMTPYIILFGIIAIAVFIATMLISNELILSILFGSMLVHLIYKKVRKETVFAALITAIIFVVAEFVIKTSTGESRPFQALLIGVLAGSIYLGFIGLSKRLKQVFISLVLLWGAIGFAYSTDHIFEKVLTDYQRTRILVMLGLKEDPLGAGYNVNQSKIAIGSGGFTGKGFLQGTQTKFNFVPEQSTDFIFCTVGEEWGFIGSAAVIILFTILLLRIIYLAEQQHSDFSRIYGYSVASIFFIHMVINIGMTIGLAPVIGIPLPFFSYGGSSLWGFTMLLFIFLKLDINRIQLIR